jgi:hypothetical protein
MLQRFDRQLRILTFSFPHALFPRQLKKHVEEATTGVVILFILQPFKTLAAMGKGILLAASLFYTLFSFAQFSDSTHYRVSYAATGVVNRTNNSNAYVFTNSLRLAARKRSVALNSSSNWIYGWQQQNLTNNDVSSLLDFNLYKTFPRFYYWGLLNYDKSYSLKIINRLQSGLGVAYSFVDREAAFFNISDGLLFETSTLRIDDTTKTSYQTVRNSLRLRYRYVFQKVIIVDGTHFWQPSLRDKTDYILNTHFSLSAKLLKWLNITTAATYNKVNRTRRENLLMTFGVAVEKYF